VSVIHVPSGVSVLAMDVHKNSISFGVLEPGVESPVIDRISTDDESVRWLINRFVDPARVWACYEAGPTGYELARTLQRAGMRCDVIAPSLIPMAPGQRVKTDKRDARRLARLFRAGELTGVRMPTVTEEAVRDLCRARADMVIDRTRARHRLGMFLLRHGRVWRGGDNWTLKHEAWIRAQCFDERALTETFNHYRATLSARDAAITAIEADLFPWATRDPFTDPVSRLAAYRGTTVLGGLTLASEVGDWRRFPTAGRFMAFTGLVPSEHSSGEHQRRGGITHTGNGHLRAQLVEAAWAYRARPNIGAGLAKRHVGVHPDTIARSWVAQQRLTTKFRRLDARKHNRKVVVTAIARELAGFFWAELTTPTTPV
jgi:transposase